MRLAMHQFKQKRATPVDASSNAARIYREFALGSHSSRHWARNIGGHKCRQLIEEVVEFGSRTNEQTSSIETEKNIMGAGER